MDIMDPVTRESIAAAKYEAAAERQILAAQLAERDGVDTLVMLNLADTHGAEFVKVYQRLRRVA